MLTLFFNNTPTPIVEAGWIIQGTQLNEIGSKIPDKRKTWLDILHTVSRVLADSLVSVREVACDLLIAVKNPNE